MNKYFKAACWVFGMAVLLFGVASAIRGEWVWAITDAIQVCTWAVLYLLARNGDRHEGALKALGEMNADLLKYSEMLKAREALWQDWVVRRLAAEKDGMEVKYRELDAWVEGNLDLEAGLKDALARWAHVNGPESQKTDSTLNENR